MSASEVIDKAVTVGGVRHKKQAHPAREKVETPLQTTVVQALDPSTVLTDLVAPPEVSNAPKEKHAPKNERIYPKNAKSVRSHHQINQPKAKSFGGGK